MTVACALGTVAVAVAVGAEDQLSVPVPFDRRFRIPFGGTFQRHGIVASYRHVRRVLRDARRSHTTCTGTSNKKQYVNTRYRT